MKTYVLLLLLISCFDHVTRFSYAWSSSLGRLAMLPQNEIIRGNNYPFPARPTATTTTKKCSRGILRKQYTALSQSNSETGNDDGITLQSSSVWNPTLRQGMGFAASLGVLETAYLTYTKISGQTAATLFCSADGTSASSTCGSVLEGPYAFIPFTDIPIATLGLVAYAAAAWLALGPLFGGSPSEDDTDNRIFLTAITTAMGTFSVFLMSLLFGVLHTSCAYCIFSAILSIGLATACWTGECLPLPPSSSEAAGSLSSTARRGLVTTGGSFFAALVASSVLFLGVEEKDYTLVASTSSTTSNSSLLASSSSQPEVKLYSPPPITMTSSERAIALSKELKQADAKMYGAYWCSHCFDQKESFGKEAFKNIQYIECSKEGINNQNALCKEKKVPGYPTWEINGQLYPGEQELEELEDIVRQKQ